MSEHAHATPNVYINEKRVSSYWDPVYGSADPAQFKPSDWDFTHNGGPEKQTFDAEKSNGLLEVKKVRFRNCDIFGEFKEYFKFSDCEFELCDFARSIFISAKFSRCRFTRCSISTATFRDSEFRDCTWSEIGMSGNTTVLDGTIITNPTEFIKSAYTNTNPNDKSGKTGKNSHQNWRLEITKSEIARTIFINHTKKGSDESYYESIKLTTTQSILESIARRKIQNSDQKTKRTTRIINTIRNAIGFSDMAIILLAATMNSWGKSVFRPAIAGVAIILLYALIYRFYFNISTMASIIKSIDISLVAGYTKHASSSDCTFTQLLLASNMLLGLFWYAIMIPTIVNRISRIR